MMLEQGLDSIRSTFGRVALGRAAGGAQRLPERTERGFWPTYGWLVTTSVAMIACYLFNLQNAGALLLLAVIHSVFLGGWKIGLASATLASLYSAIFLSIPGQIFHYAEAEVRGLVGIAVACYGAVFLIMRLRRGEVIVVQRQSEEARREEIARQSERQLRSIADGAPVLLWIADEAGRRTFFNKPWLKFTGKTLEEQAGDGWHKSIHPEDVSAAVSRYSAAVRSCERYQAEYRLLDASGEYAWVSDMGSPRIGADGRYVGYIGVCVDRTERKRVESALHQLSGRLLELQDDERRRISRELHDTTAQNLAVVSMNLCVLKEAVEGQLVPRVRHALDESLSLAERCSLEIRTLSYLLHPPLLDELGLASALRSYSAGFTQRTGIQVELKMDEIGRLPRDVETTLFRIVQEALTNVHRHSGSLRAEVRVIRDPKEVKLQVSDDGRGVPADTLELLSVGANLGVGVAGMRERAAQLGGQVKIASSGRGTTITAILPWRNENDAS
jgi:PAS domain S-box-containing protein